MGSGSDFNKRYSNEEIRDQDRRKERFGRDETSAEYIKSQDKYIPYDQIERMVSTQRPMLYNFKSRKYVKSEDKNYHEHLMQIKRVIIYQSLSGGNYIFIDAKTNKIQIKEDRMFQVSYEFKLQEMK